MSETVFCIFAGSFLGLCALGGWLTAGLFLP